MCDFLFFPYNMVRDSHVVAAYTGIDPDGSRRDMLEAALPPADLLITKDTLIHFPNAAIQQFLNACA